MDMAIISAATANNIWRAEESEKEEAWHPKGNQACQQMKALVLEAPKSAHMHSWDGLKGSSKRGMPAENREPKDD